MKSSLRMIVLMALDFLLLREFAFVWLFLLLLALYIILGLTRPQHRRKYGDMIVILLIFLGLWAALTRYVPLKNPGLYPQPIVILNLLAADFPKFIVNFGVSMRAFLLGIGLAFPAGVATGTLLGLNERVRAAFDPYVKVIGSISPVAYVPYIIGIMPTFWAASVFVIFFGTVWHVMKWTMHGIATLDRNIYTCARLMNVSRRHFFTGILLPGILPSVLEGTTQAIAAGFSVLIAAEMIGSRNGLGFYIKYYADFLNYPKVIVGILYLGASICVVTGLLGLLKNRLLRWQSPR